MKKCNQIALILAVHLACTATETEHCLYPSLPVCITHAHMHTHTRTECAGSIQLVCSIARCRVNLLAGRIKTLRLKKYFFSMEEGVKEWP